MIHATKLLIFVVIGFGGCSAKKIVTITDEITGRSVNYDCTRFQSQVKTSDEIRALSQRSIQVARRANQEGNKALARSIYSARAFRDTLRLEELVIMDECEHLK